MASLESYVGTSRKYKGPKKWALLNRLIIRCNTEVLSTGVMLIDLPGSGDCSTTVLRAADKVKNNLDVKLIAVLPARAASEAVIIGEHP